jgi:hypothetical protein
LDVGRHLSTTRNLRRLVAIIIAGCKRQPRQLVAEKSLIVLDACESGAFDAFRGDRERDNSRARVLNNNVGRTSAGSAGGKQTSVAPFNR